MPPAPARIDELKKRYEENPRRFFAPLANEYRKAGDLEAAIDLCRMHLEEQPGHLSGHIVYGQALYESRRTADARQAFESALTLDPENLIALRHLGDIAKAEGDAPSATHWYQRVLDADPRNDEVIALIAQVNAAPPPASTVVVVEQEAPPPPPQYAEAAAHERASLAVDPSAPTPIIPMAAVPAVTPPPLPPIAARGNIGLLDLNLDLGDNDAPSVDLLGGVTAQSAAPPLGDIGIQAVEPPAPVFEEGFQLIDGTLPPVVPDGPELLGAEDTNLGLAAPDDALLEVHDTSFGIEPPVEEPTFATAHEPAAFGDSLDPTASIEMDLPAAPPPPTAADFDMLFGNTPIADVQVGGDSTGEAASDEGFIADSFIGREPSDATLEHAPDIGAPPSPFVTETMAELYLQQGFREEALNVYRQLLAANPGDEALAERVMHLEHGGRSSLSIDRASDAIVAESIAEEKRRTGSIPTVPSTPAVAEMVPDATPAFLVELPPIVEPVMEPAELPATYDAPRIDEDMPALAGEPPVVEAEALAYEPPVVEAEALAYEPPVVEAEALAYEPPVAEAEAVAYVPPVVEAEAVAYEPPVVEALAPAFESEIVAPVHGPTVRDILWRIAQRRAVPGGGCAPEPAAEFAAAPIFEPATEPAPVFAVEPDAPSSLGELGAVDKLFGFSGVGPSDEGAAAAVSAAFAAVAAVAAVEAAVSATPITGEPTRRGSGELSLDSVFKGEPGTGARSAPTVQRQSTKLRFDQFFAPADEASSEAPASQPPLPSAGRGDDDIAQFSDWLKGLKGS